MAPIERYGTNERAGSKGSKELNMRDPDELNMRNPDKLTLRT
jgi:hypothetical protein